MSRSDRRIQSRIKELESNRAKAGPGLRPAYDRAIQLLAEASGELERLEKSLEVEAAAQARLRAESGEKFAASLRDIESRTAALLARETPATDLERDLESIERSKLLIDIRTIESRVARTELEETVRSWRDQRLAAVIDRWRRIMDPPSKDPWLDGAKDGLMIAASNAAGPLSDIAIKILERALENQRSFDTTNKHLEDLARFCTFLEDWCAAARAAHIGLDA